MNCVTCEQYMEKHKKLIKRERRAVIREHLKCSYVIIVLLAALLLITLSYERPRNWHEMMITFDHSEVVSTGRSGVRLDIYDTNGHRYTINRNEGNIKDQLIPGQQYILLYADNLFHDTVEEISINGVEYVNYDDSVKNYWGTKTIFFVLIGMLFVLLIFANILVYHASTKDGMNKIRRYKERIHNKTLQ